MGGWLVAGMRQLPLQGHRADAAVVMRGVDVAASSGE